MEMSTTRLQYQLELVLQNNWQVLTSQSTYLASLATFIIILSITEGLFWFILSITEGLRIYQNQSTDHLLFEKKGKKALYWTEENNKKQPWHACGFWSWLSARKTTPWIRNRCERLPKRTCGNWSHWRH